MDSTLNGNFIRRRRSPLLAAAMSGLLALTACGGESGAQSTSPETTFVIDGPAEGGEPAERVTTTTQAPQTTTLEANPAYSFETKCRGYKDLDLLEVSPSDFAELTAPIETSADVWNVLRGLSCLTEYDLNNNTTEHIAVFLNPEVNPTGFQATADLVSQVAERQAYDRSYIHGYSLNPTSDKYILNPDGTLEVEVELAYSNDGSRTEWQVLKTTTLHLKQVPYTFATSTGGETLPVWTIL